MIWTTPLLIYYVNLKLLTHKLPQRCERSLLLLIVFTGARSHPAADERHLSRVGCGSLKGKSNWGPTAWYGNTACELLSPQCHAGSICHHFKTNPTFSGNDWEMSGAEGSQVALKQTTSLQASKFVKVKEKIYTTLFSFRVNLTPICKNVWFTFNL